MEDLNDSPPYAFGSGSSSSSDDHSSPSDSSHSAYASPQSATHLDWSVELGLSTLPGVQAGIVQLPQSGWAAPEHQFNKVVPAAEPEALTLTSDFWTSAPSTTVHSPAAAGEGHFGSQQSDYFAQSEAVKMEEDYTLDGDDGMQVEFEDMVHDNVCGPSSLPSPREDYTPASISAPSLPASTDAPDQVGSQASQYPRHLSMPIDLLAVNAGISPHLTGGQPSPPPVEYAEQPDALTSSRPQRVNAAISRSERSARSSDHSADGDASAGHSRESSRARAPAKGRKSATAVSTNAPAPAPSAVSVAPPPSAAHPVGPSTNLVTKDAVIASHVLTSLALPPRGGAPPMELLVLGVPTVGAKSRVETQIKITLVLVSTKPGVVSTKSDGRSEQGLPGERFITPDGGLQPAAGGEYERVGQYTHLRLPRLLAIKKRGKKGVQADPPLDDTLSLSVAVLRSSSPNQAPSEEIFICQGCQAREHKRAQRKKDSRLSGAGALAADEHRDEEEERRKVVVFNCAEFVEFGAGETVLPTRITCYCRHHKEKKGFQVSFTLHDSSDNLVAQGLTPPIMITDDHKTKDASQRPPTILAAAAAPQPTQDVSFDEITEPAPKPKRNKAAKAGKKEKASISTATGRPKRASGRAKAARGQTESEEEAAESATSSAASRGPAARKQAQPYDSDARPSRKRSSNGTHRSPGFAMTPLSVPSPPTRPVGLGAASNGAFSPAQLPSPVDSTGPSMLAVAAGQVQAMQLCESALGLERMGHSITTDSGPDYHPRQQSFSTDHSSAASPTHYDAAGSTGALSPRSADTSINDFSSLFFHNQSPPLPTSTTPTLFNNISPSLPEYHYAPQQQQQQQQAQASVSPFAPPSATWPATFAQQQALARPLAPQPRISRLIPGEGPVHGGIEVTILGENFVPDLTCVFGDTAAMPTHFWSSNTLVCVLPPSPNPGPVVVGIKGVPLTVEQGNGLQLFTYKDDSDRSLLELALQVVGLKMTGRLEDASAVAMRIVGNNSQQGAAGSAAGSRHTSPGGATTYATAELAQTLNAAASSVYNSPASSRPGSRVHSRRGSLVESAALPPLPYSANGGEARNFEGIVLKFLSLLDLDPSLIPGSAPSLPSTQPPISHLNSQDHNLLHLATVLGFHRLVQFLLARGIDFDSPDRNGYTPLHFAALYGRVAIARQLVDAGAYTRARNHAGRTALDIAQDRDDVDVEEILQRARYSSAIQTPRSRFVSPALGYAPSSPQQTYSPAIRTSNQRSSSMASSYHSRYASTQGSPVSSYGEDLSGGEEQSESESSSDAFSSDSRSDFSDSGSSAESDSEDDSDGSFHSSDEEESEVEELRRRTSRNASMVSLHYLLEAEENVRNAAASPLSIKDWPLLDSKSAPVSGTSSPRDAPSTPSSEIPPATQAPLHQLASASSAWLFNRSRAAPEKKEPIGVRRQPPSFHDKLQPLSDGMNGMWEKAKANRLYIPLQIQMPELTAFQSMATSVPFSMGWRGSKGDEVEAEGEGEGGGTETGAESDATVMPARSSRSARDDEKSAHRDWRTLYGGPWFKGPSSPPPMYSATDHLQPAPALPRTPSTSLFKPLPSPPVASTSKSSRSSRRSSATASEMDVAVGFERQGDYKKTDVMIFVFWIPVLVLVLSVTIYANFGVLQPALDTTLDLVLPRSVVRAIMN